MAINVFLQTVEGKRKREVIDPFYSLATIWPCGDEAYPLLQYIDPYGNTIFNGLQMPEVQRELDLLIAKAPSDEQKKILSQIRDLAEICRKQPHIFLRFRGD